MAHAENEQNHPENTVYQNIRTVLVAARQKIYTAINSAMVQAYWDIGRQIEQAIGDRAEYGRGLLQYISKELTSEFGKGFDVTNLRKMRQFYQVFPIRDALRLELSWTHYRLLMKVDNTPRREFYMTECVESNWSSRQSGRGWRCWLVSGCVFACFPPCAPFGLSGKAWRRFFGPVSAYQVYAGIGFFVVLGADFSGVELDCQRKALEVEKYGNLREARAPPLSR